MKHICMLSDIIAQCCMLNPIYHFINVILLTCFWNIRLGCCKCPDIIYNELALKRYICIGVDVDDDKKMAHNYLIRKIYEHFVLYAFWYPYFITNIWSIQELCQLIFKNLLKENVNVFFWDYHSLFSHRYIYLTVLAVESSSTAQQQNYADMSKKWEICIVNITL